jgi:steroid 5-alpha reductase family enzyme
MIYAFLVILFLQIVFFVYAALKKTDKVTDLSYGLTFVIVSLFLYIQNIEYSSVYKVILLSLVIIWGLRLAIYLFARILKTGKDKRFDGVREDLKRFGSFWLLQAISIFVILLPTIYVLIGEDDISFNWVSFFGFVLSVLGIVIETFADSQKFIFKNNENNKSKWIETGLWKYSRHPNYLGEIFVWVGILIYCLPYLYGWGLLTVVSPIYITVLLVFVSGIPTLEMEYEKRYLGNKEYEEYKKKTGVLFPKIF